jgi:integrase
VKRALAAIDVDTTDYSGHSLRAGLVTAAAMAGVSERIIMQQTGHKNTAMLRRYIREAHCSARTQLQPLAYNSLVSSHKYSARTK